MKFDVNTYKKLRSKSDQQLRNNDEFDQLIFFYNIMASQWCYNLKDLYFRFITRYLNDSIDSGELSYKILSLDTKRCNYIDKIEGDFDALSNLWINSKLEPFVSILVWASRHAYLEINEIRKY